jgi:hypothetical protein
MQGYFCMQRIGLFLFVIALCLLGAAVLVTGQGDASNGAGRLADLLLRLESQETYATVRVLDASASEESLLNVGGGEWTVSDYGADYICFKRPLEDVSQVYCLPLSNIASVTYVER